MAVLTGFPPSNTIQIDQPGKRICELCGKAFLQSFPLTLYLDIASQTNYGILPCPQCWKQDQGNEYWGTDTNKWGDRFCVYSKVRENHSTEDLQKAEE